MAVWRTWGSIVHVDMHVVVLCVVGNPQTPCGRETIIMHGPQADSKLVGTDYNGNKYYENNHMQFGA